MQMFGKHLYFFLIRILLQRIEDMHDTMISIRKLDVIPLPTYFWIVDTCVFLNLWKDKNNEF